MRGQQIDGSDIFSREKAAFDNNNGRLSSFPYYIQELERKIATIDYKLNMVLEKLNKIQNPEK